MYFSIVLKSVIKSLSKTAELKVTHPSSSLCTWNYRVFGNFKKSISDFLNRFLELEMNYRKITYKLNTETVRFLDQIIQTEILNTYLEWSNFDSENTFKFIMYSNMLLSTSIRSIVRKPFVVKSHEVPDNQRTRKIQLGSKTIKTIRKRLNVDYVSYNIEKYICIFYAKMGKKNSYEYNDVKFFELFRKFPHRIQIYFYGPYRLPPYSRSID